MITKAIVEIIINTFKYDSWDYSLEDTVFNVIMIVVGITLLFPAGIFFDILFLPLEIIGVIIYLINRKRDE